MPTSRTRNLIKEFALKGVKSIVIAPDYTDTSKNYEAEYPSFYFDLVKQDLKQNFSQYKYEIDKEQDPKTLCDKFNKKYEIIGAVNCGDASINYATILQSYLGLPSNSNEWRENCIDKAWVNNRLKQNNIRYIKTKAVDSKYDINSIKKEFPHLPLFIKPLAGGGSVECYKINSYKELEEKLDGVFSRGLFDKMLVQEYINGEIYIVDCVSFDGQHYFTDAWKYTRVLTSKNGFIFKDLAVVEHSPLLQQMINYTVNSLKACGFMNGISHSEIAVDAYGPVLIEINWRIMGGICMLEEKIVNDYNQNQVLVQSFLEPKKLQASLLEVKQNQKVSAIILTSNLEEKKTIVKYNVYHILKHLSSYKNNPKLINEGEKFIFTNNYDDSLAFIDLVNKDYGKLVEERKLIWDMQDNAFELFVEYKEGYKNALLPKNTDMKDTFDFNKFKSFFGNKKVAKITSLNNLSTIKTADVLVISKNIFSTDVCKCFDEIEKIYSNAKKGVILCISNYVIANSIKGINYLFALNKFNVLVLNKNNLSSDFYIFGK